MAAQFRDMIAMLICDDVQESIAFYTEALGFTVTGRMDSIGKSGWASLNNGPVQLMLASPHYVPESHKSDGRYSQAMYYFYPDDVQALHNSLKNGGWDVTNMTVRFYGMKEFEILIPSGHVLIFGQETDEAPEQEQS